MIVLSNRIGQAPSAGDQTRREGGLAPANAVDVKGMMQAPGAARDASSLAS
ncbi:hypothetical protein [Pseudomonas sp. CGJS7]|uniref:hypothetical protein n=1 Tax=Pseudomonas sp. CGJS7 TaxID=3109348 RepID=UPI00300B08C3